MDEKVGTSVKKMSQCDVEALKKLRAQLHHLVNSIVGLIERASHCMDGPGTLSVTGNRGFPSNLISTPLIEFSPSMRGATPISGILYGQKQNHRRNHSYHTSRSVMSVAHSLDFDSGNEIETEFLDFVCRSEQIQSDLISPVRQASRQTEVPAEIIFDRIGESLSGPYTMKSSGSDIPFRHGVGGYSYGNIGNLPSFEVGVSCRHDLSKGGLINPCFQMHLFCLYLWFLIVAGIMEFSFPCHISFFSSYFSTSYHPNSWIPAGKLKPSPKKFSFFHPIRQQHPWQIDTDMEIDPWMLLEDGTGSGPASGNNSVGVGGDHSNLKASNLLNGAVRVRKTDLTYIGNVDDDS
ncbi:uncharacterized protein LOC143859074 isoform X2 [Tasmannia lanceolata]